MIECVSDGDGNTSLRVHLVSFSLRVSRGYRGLWTWWSSNWKCGCVRCFEDGVVMGCFTTVEQSVV